MARKLAQVSESIRGEMRREMQELRDIMRRELQELAWNGGEKFGPDGSNREKPGNQRTIDQIPPEEKLKGMTGETDSAKGGSHGRTPSVPPPHRSSAAKGQTGPHGPDEAIVLSGMAWGNLAFRDDEGKRVG
ncbi:unnamed protein product [Linum trigynum]|uniref:Uncharacterized protein n=1 Tax=Linum trigynum TaxID=586398 RepID=A0AAV2CHV8_9ROSI